MSVAIGLAIAMQFNGRVGDAVLATAVVSTVLGEITAAPILRRMLRAKGEVVDPPPQGRASGEPTPIEEAQEAEALDPRTTSEPETVE
jgi:hypothetical protein